MGPESRHLTYISEGFAIDRYVRTADIEYHKTSIVLSICDAEGRWQPRYFGVCNIIPRNIVSNIPGILCGKTCLSRMFIKNKITTAGIR